MKSTDHAKVLIVEDEGIIANHLAARLLIAGYEVTGIAQSAEDALQQIQDRAPEVILMDIHLKGRMDGIETTTALRQQIDVPVIYLTAFSDQQTIDRAKKTGASGFLTKPVQYSALGNAIEMALNNQASEREIRSQRAWMRTVLNKIDDPTAVVDDRRKIQYLNSAAEKLSGWSCEAARGLDVDLILPTEASPPDMYPGALLREPVNGHAAQARPAGLTAPKNSGQWLRTESEMSLSVDGEEVVGAVIQFVDAKSRHEQEVELRHDNKMRAVGRLAAGVAHDFNNLVFIILGYTDELLEKAKPGFPESDALTKIRKAAANAATLADQLLTFSRKDPKEKKEIDLNELIYAEEESFRRLAGPRIDIELRLERSLNTVLAQQGQLQQVLTNLVTNARDAMPEGGKITIQSMNKCVPGVNNGPAAQQNFVQFRVADTGIGMTGETAERLFEPFFTTKKAGKGTGLGLAIVHNIIEDLGGSIRAESQPGRGSVFTVSLPCASAQHVPLITAADSIASQDSYREPPAQLCPPVTSDGTATVLLIEDESGVRHLLRDYLTGGGYKVVEAANGEEGLALASEHHGRIDLLITDVVMPNVGGFEIARTLAQTRPAIKTLFISGYAADFIEDEANFIGEKLLPDMRFLVKPFLRADFLTNVGDLLRGGSVLHAGAHS